MKILGIDPGSRRTGWGVVGCSTGTVAHAGHGTVRLAPGDALAARLAALHQAILDVIDAHAPNLAVVESPFVAASPRAALILGHARGAVLAALGQRAVRVLELSPAEIKVSVTGNGTADKRQVQEMVQRLLALPRLPAQDAADALAAALSAAQRRRFPLPRGRGSVRPRARRVEPALPATPALRDALAALGAPRGRAARFVLRRG